MTTPSSSPLRFVPVALAAIVCVIAYLPALHGGFLFDDFLTILQNPALQAANSESRSWLAIALSSDTGLLRRPLSMLSFGANVALFGMSPFAFKAVNLALHLLNGMLLFALARRLATRWLVPETHRTTATGVALFVASAWLLHPLNVSGVVYVVQRMNELATLFTLIGLLSFTDARARMLAGEAKLGQALFGLCLFGVLAMLCKENGALIVLYALVIESLAFRFEARTVERRVLKGFFWLTLGVPLTLFAIYLAAHPGWFAASYSIRDFSLLERVLTEARALCFYLLWIAVPNPAWMGIYHDDIAVSTSLLSPTTTLAAVISLVLLAGSAFALRHRQPAYAFAVAWFLAGHSMESTVLPLELVFEHRNYLPMAGLLIGMTCVVANWVNRSNRFASIAIAVAILSVVTCAALTATRAGDWSDPLRLALADVRHHPDSARCQFEAGRAIVIDGAQHGRREAADAEALPHFDRTAALDPSDTHGLIAGLLIRARKGPVESSLVSDLRRRLAATPTYTRANPFLDLLVTASTEKLGLSPADVAGLVEAALANAHFPPKVRAMVLNNYGAYQFNVVRDTQAAISLTLTASAEDPKNPYFRLNLAKIAWAIKDVDHAKAYLEQARQLDGARARNTEIEALSHEISSPPKDAQHEPGAPS